MEKEMRLRDKAQLVAEMLPGHTLNFRGEVVEAETCPLCNGMLDGWTPINTLLVNGKPVSVHQICPAGGDNG